MNTELPTRRSKPTAAQWYCLVVGLFLLVRAVTTLVGDAEFTLPGSGWRATLQLVVAVVLLAGLRAAPVPVVIGVGVLYAAETVLGFLGGGAILGVIPVDMRDRIVHPSLALIAALTVSLTLRVAQRRGSHA
ncbi:hypothetical protein [Nocardia sp. NPDC005366]|uniref:hypothetical protein n=1 Tax=Nocardia sp. NPDC005366 TaxID=3156878 RepID=UPI0033B8D6BF